MKNPDDQQLFFEETSNTTLLTSNFSESSDFQKNAHIFFKRLNNCVRKCFKKVRIQSNNFLRQYGQPGIQEKLVIKRKLKIFLMNHKGKGFKEIVNHRIDEIDNFLIDKCA